MVAAELLFLLIFGRSTSQVPPVESVEKFCVESRSFVFQPIFGLFTNVGVFCVLKLLRDGQWTGGALTGLALPDASCGVGQAR